MDDPLSLDNVFIIAYTRGSGGKFLANCLALSHSVLFQHMEIANKQMLKNMSSDDKIDFLLTQLGDISGDWNDLNMGEFQLFGIDDEKSLTKSWTESTDVFTNIKRLGFNCPITCHSPEHLEELLNIFTQARVILFVDNKEFLLRRAHKTLGEYWNQIRGPSWPLDPPKSKVELQQLPDFIQQELSGIFHNEINLYYEPDVNTMRMKHVLEFSNRDFIEWSCLNYNSELKLIAGLVVLFDVLGLEYPNWEHIKTFYHTWTNKLDEIKNLGFRNH